MTKREIWYWLSTLPSWEGKTVGRVLECLGPLEAVWNARQLPVTPAQQREAEERRREPERLAEELEALEQRGIRFVCREDPDFPPRLRRWRDGPFFLFALGSLPPEGPAAALVGARKCTEYGRLQAEELGRFLAENGVAVISGLALGVDGAAQRGALRAGGYSCGVLGTGVDVCYPASHRTLYRELQEKGGLISEYAPGSPPLPYHFPLRNRLISGLADLTVVVEAGKKSGSLITADWALEQGKDVLAVPGRMGDPMSQGCNRLIRQGAGIVAEPGDILEALGMGKKKRKSPEPRLTAEEQAVWRCLGTEPAGLDQICAESGQPVGAALMILLRLEMRQLVRQTGAGQYLRVPGRGPGAG